MEAKGPVDFGWGEPVKFGPIEILNGESAIFRPCGKNGKGISMILALPSPTVHNFEEMMAF